MGRPMNHGEVSNLVRIMGHGDRGTKNLLGWWKEPALTTTSFLSMVHGYYHTSPSNLPAPGRCQTLYIVLPLGRVLCF